jgi:hypothetical protein
MITVLEFLLLCSLDRSVDLKVSVLKRRYVLFNKVFGLGHHVTCQDPAGVPLLACPSGKMLRETTWIREVK